MCLDMTFRSCPYRIHRLLRNLPTARWLKSWLKVTKFIVILKEPRLRLVRERDDRNEEDSQLQAYDTNDG